MQFIAEDPVHCVVRTEVKPMYDPSGTKMISPKQRRLFAKFKRGTAPYWAAQIGIQTYAFNKRHPEVEPARWLSFYDSLEAQHEYGWTDEERDAIEQNLLTNHPVLRVEPPKPNAPYGNYDKHRKTTGKRTIDHAIRDIEAAYLSAGFDLGEAVVYEQATLNDPRVLEALHALAAPVESDEPAEELISA